MSKSILICDDHEAILEVTRLILTREGYTVDTVKTSNEIFDKVKEMHPDLILMDLRLPQIGGEEATKKLKADPDTQQIPIIIFSANNKGNEVAEKAGADGFICKPYEIQELLEIIKSKTSDN